MAEIFLARAPAQPGAEPLVAIKRILPWANDETDFTNMFIDEACISASLKHPNIARVHEFGQEQGHYFLAMEYASGRDLRSVLNYLQRTGVLPPVPLVLVVGMRLAQALDYAHRQKRPDGTPMEIIHRDVSPPNVLLTYDGGVKLIDFGIAKASSRATRTRAGRLKGKIAYMSPEQVQGKNIDQRADLFSLGVLLYELITARSLFHGKNQIDTMHQVRKADVPPPSSINPDVPGEVDALLLKALARDREERYQSAANLREEIQRYLVRSRAVFGPEHLMRWMHEHFEGALAEERHTLKQARTLSIEDYPETAEDEDAGTPPPAFPDEKPANLPSYKGGAQMQMDLKATVLDDAIPAAMAEEHQFAADRVLDVTPRDGTDPLLDDADTPPAGVTPPLAGGEASPALDADTPPLLDADTPPMGDADAPPLLDADTPPLLDADTPPMGDGITPRDGTEPAIREEATPVVGIKLPSPPPAPPSVPSMASLTDTFNSAWTPADGLPLDAPPPPIDPDDAPTDLAVSAFTAKGELADTLDRKDPITVEPPALQEDATLVDRPLFPAEEHTPSAQPIAPGDNRDRAVAGGELSVPQGQDAGGPRVEPIAPGSQRDSMSVGGFVSVPSQDDIPPVPELEDVSRVSVEGIDDGTATGYFTRQEPQPAPASPAPAVAPQSTWSQAPAEKRRRFSSTQIIVFAAALTLVLVGIIAVITLLPGKRAGTPGTIVVTSEPPAACTISLDDTAKGLLSPGAAVNLTGIAAGSHHIAVNCVGYKPFATDIEVEGGGVNTVVARLSREKK